MNDQLYFCNVPALNYPFIELPQSELDSILSNTRFILDRLERAKKGVVVLNHFQNRLRDKQVVRCTPQSVKVTAAARYAPSSEDINLSNISTVLFVDLITYLPLPEIRVMASNYDALYAAGKIAARGGVDQRWGTYYTCLGAVNTEWARLFFNEIQEQLASRGEIADPQTDVDSGYRMDFDETSDKSMEHDIPHNIRSDIVAELSEHTTYQQAGLSTHETIIPITNTEDTTHTTTDPWQRDTAPTDHANLIDFEQDQAMYTRALQAKEKAWGSNHPTTLATVRKLGEFYTEHGMVNQAEAMYVRVFQASERGREGGQRGL